MIYNSYPFPWKHYIIEDVLQQEDFEKIKNLEINDADYDQTHITYDLFHFIHFTFWGFAKCVTATLLRCEPRECVTSRMRNCETA